MGNKQKGSKAERELYQMFVDANYRAVRVAGSGTMDNADCDLIAGKKGKKYCIEVKSTKKTIKYISKEQMESFIVFSQIFGLKPVIAVRFDRVGWFFLNPKSLNESGKNWGISLKNARKKGKKFAQYFGEKAVESKKKVKAQNNELDLIEECHEGMVDEDEGQTCVERAVNQDLEEN